MRVLITGAAGFVGRHLINELSTHGHDCIATDLAIAQPIPRTTACESLDIRDAEALGHLIDRVQPEACIHMAGITFVPEGIANPDLMLSVNVRGTGNILDAFRALAPAARVLTVSTAHVYGYPPRHEALTENAPLAPLSMYAISKVASDLATLAAAKHHGMHAMVARPNNHTGPGQQPRFVTAAFAHQVRDIAEGRAEPVISVGNLESERDFTDVRDVTRAYRLLIEHGHPGKAYNISSRHTESMRDMLSMLCRLAGIEPRIVVDPERVRPTDWSPRLDITRLATDTGWCPEITFEQTLQDMLAER